MANTTSPNLKITIQPSTVKITDKAGEIVLGTITVELLNEGDDIDLTGMVISLPVGKLDTDLILRTAGMDALVGQPEWRLDHTSPDGTYEADPSTGDSVLFRKDTTFSFTFKKMVLSNLVGTAQVKVTVNLLNGEPVERLVDVVKTINSESKAFFSILPPNVRRGAVSHVKWSGVNITEYTVSSSDGARPVTTYVPSQMEVKPEKQTVYTLDATKGDLHLQLQLTLSVFNPEILAFTISPETIDVGGSVTVRCKTKYADAIKMECSDRAVPLNPSYPPKPLPDPQPGPDDPEPERDYEFTIGPITQAVRLKAIAITTGVEGGSMEKILNINPPLVDEFTITALPVSGDKPFQFRLNWKLRNASGFKITKDDKVSQVVEIPVPEGATTFIVTPNTPQTDYMIKASPMPVIQKKKTEDTTEE